jgi:hypothetical protein
MSRQHPAVSDSFVREAAASPLCPDTVEIKNVIADRGRLTAQSVDGSTKNPLLEQGAKMFSPFPYLADRSAGIGTLRGLCAQAAGLRRAVSLHLS